MVPGERHAFIKISPGIRGIRLRPPAREMARQSQRTSAVGTLPSGKSHAAGPHHRTAQPSLTQPGPAAAVRQPDDATTHYRMTQTR